MLQRSGDLVRGVMFVLARKGRLMNAPTSIRPTRTFTKPGSTASTAFSTLTPTMKPQSYRQGEHQRPGPCPAARDAAAAGCIKIFSETASGALRERPELALLLEYLRRRRFRSSVLNSCGARGLTAPSGGC